MLKGIVIKESLEDEDVLKEFSVTGTKIVNIDKPAEGQSPVWTPAYFDVADEEKDAVAEKLSKALRPGKWYVDFKSDTDVYVIFLNKTFHYKRDNEVEKQLAVDYARSIGVSEKQLG